MLFRSLGLSPLNPILRSEGSDQLTLKKHYHKSHIAVGENLSLDKQAENRINLFCLTQTTTTTTTTKTNKFSLLILSVLVLLCGCYTELGLCRQDNFLKMKLGGVHDCKGSQNSGEIDSLARFAVQEHNTKEVFSSLDLFLHFLLLKFLIFFCETFVHKLCS